MSIPYLLTGALMSDEQLRRRNPHKSYENVRDYLDRVLDLLRLERNRAAGKVVFASIIAFMHVA